jgi:hypothetical protein
MTSTGILAWFPLVKTYSLSTLLLFGAYLALCEVSDRKPLVLGGLLLGLAIDTRLYRVAMVPVFLTFCPNRRLSPKGRHGARCCWPARLSGRKRLAVWYSGDVMWQCPRSPSKNSRTKCVACDKHCCDHDNRLHASYVGVLPLLLCRGSIFGPRGSYLRLHVDSTAYPGDAS